MSSELFIFCLLVTSGLGSGLFLQKISKSFDDEIKKTLRVYERNYLWQSNTSLGSPTTIPSK